MKKNPALYAVGLLLCGCLLLFGAAIFAQNQTQPGPAADGNVSVGVQELEGADPVLTPEADPEADGPDEEAADEESKSVPEAAAAGPRPGQVRLKEIRAIRQNGLPAVKLVATGGISGTLTYLSAPERALLKIPDARLACRGLLAVKQPPLLRVRAAQHGSEVWVVLDLSRAGLWKQTNEPRGLVLSPGEGRTAASRPEAVEPHAEPAATDASYQVIDVAVADLENQTQISVTTDGPVRYRVKKAKGEETLQLEFFGAALGWQGPPANLPQGVVARISARQIRLEGEPAVLLEARLNRMVPYVIFKEQNQVMVAFDHPGLEQENPPAKGNLHSPVSLDFQNADLASFLRALAQDAGFDLILTPGAQGLSGEQAQVTVSVNDQPLSTVLDLVLKPRKLAYEVSGNTLRVGLASEFPTETRVFALKHIDVKQANLKESLQSAFTDGARSSLTVDPAGNRVVVTAIRGDLQRVEAMLNRMDVASRLLSRTFTLNYGDARKIAPLIEPMLSSSAALEINEADNALIVTDIPGTLQRVSSLIRSLDSKTRQVMIEARIVEISQSDEQDLGIRWNAITHDATANPRVTASSNPLIFGTVGSIAVGTLQSGVDINATLSALEAKGMVNTISNPRIATLDNQSAKISASQDIPYTTSMVSNGVVSTVVNYLKLPIELEVTPHIAKNRQVVLRPATLTVTTVVNPGNPPETSTRSASTQMVVGDGETIAIGGLFRIVENTKESKIPLLGDIPLLGLLFKSSSTVKNKVALVVFLTPHVLE